jgi:hypothetical protein
MRRFPARLIEAVLVLLLLTSFATSCESSEEPNNTGNESPPKTEEAAPQSESDAATTNEQSSTPAEPASNGCTAEDASRTPVSLSLQHALPITEIHWAGKYTINEWRSKLLRLGFDKVSLEHTNPPPRTGSTTTVGLKDTRFF